MKQFLKRVRDCLFGLAIFVGLAVWLGYTLTKPENYIYYGEPAR